MCDRNVFILPGISREAFVETGVRMTVDEEDLNYYVHDHKHDPYGEIPCTDRCKLIRMGKVMENDLSVTLSDDAKSQSVA